MTDTINTLGTENAPGAQVRRRITKSRASRTQRVHLSKEQVEDAADRAEQNPMLRKMKAKPNWESEDFVGVGQDGVDRLRIPDETVLALARDGVALQWITRSIRGQETPNLVAPMTRGGWTPVYQSDFDGVLNGLFMPKNNEDTPIVVDDCMLVARPIAIQSKAERARNRDANLPLQISQEQIGQGIPGVTGATHPTALMGNKIKMTRERIAIPEV
jgi:hypothetical protein